MTLSASKDMRKSANPQDKLNEFLNKKKVPGILEFLESKIYQRYDSQLQRQSPMKQYTDETFEKDEEEKFKEWNRASAYYSMEFDQEEGLNGFASKKQPLIDHRKRKLLSHLLKNENLVVKSVHNQLIERIIYGKKEGPTKD